MPWRQTEGVLGAGCSGGSGGVAVRVSCNVMAGAARQGAEGEGDRGSRVTACVQSFDSSR